MILSILQLLLLAQLHPSSTLSFNHTTIIMPSHTDSLPNFDKLWNYGNPAATEAKFRELLPIAEQSGDASYHAQLLTQIARTYSLRSQFAEAHALLDSADHLIAAHLTEPSVQLAKVRSLLERGRCYNSGGEKVRSIPYFEQAAEVANEIEAWRFAIDAVHMVAIAKLTTADQIEWNLKAIEMVTAHPEQRGWLNALYNNLAEAYSSEKQYDQSLKHFQLLVELQREKGEPDMYTLKDVARAYRMNGDAKASLAIIQPIFDKLQSTQADDGWIREELAEALELAGDHASARPHFIKAYELLSTDKWVIDNDPKKLERLQMMSK